MVLPTESRLKIFDWQVVDQPLPPAPTASAWASELHWLSATNGWGVIGKNVANKDAANSPDLPLRSTTPIPRPGSRRSTRRAWACTPCRRSRTTWAASARVHGQVGLEAGFGGNVIFKVDADGANRYQSRTFTPGSRPSP